MSNNRLYEPLPPFREQHMDEPLYFFDEPLLGFTGYEDRNFFYVAVPYEDRTYAMLVIPVTRKRKKDILNGCLTYRQAQVHREGPAYLVVLRARQDEVTQLDARKPLPDDYLVGRKFRAASFIKKYRETDKRLRRKRKEKKK